MSEKMLKEEDLEKVAGGQWVYDEVINYNWMCNVEGCIYNRMSWKTQSSVPGACPECGSTNITPCGTVKQYVKRWEPEN